MPLSHTGYKFNFHAIYFGLSRQTVTQLERH